VNPVERTPETEYAHPPTGGGTRRERVYGWRGAENAIDRLPDDYGTLYLTQSFRFGPDIAATAREILASRPDGGPEQQLIGAADPGRKHRIGASAILCRTNVGVVRAAVRMIRNGARTHVSFDLGELTSQVESAAALHR